MKTIYTITQTDDNHQAKPNNPKRMITLHKQKPMICNYCMKPFKYRSRFEDHIKQHEAEGVNASNNNTITNK